MSVQALAWAMGTKTGSPSRKAVLLALANRHNSDTGLCCPSIANIARETELSRRSVSDQLQRLCDLGLIESIPRTRENGSRTSNQYVICMGVVQEVHGGSDCAAPPEPELEPEVEPEPHTAFPGDRDLVVQAWKANAPPLISHRSSYYTDDTTIRAIARALRKYPAEDLTAAISDFATVLGDDAYRWTHSWPLVEFLKRGLDRFVPEAHPLENFRVNGNGKMSLLQRLDAMKAEGSLAP